jgi:hypothetical protein
MEETQHPSSNPEQLGSQSCFKQRRQDDTFVGCHKWYTSRLTDYWTH